MFGGVNNAGMRATKNIKTRAAEMMMAPGPISWWKKYRVGSGNSWVEFLG
jgi:hypothetical protein